MLLRVPQGKALEKNDCLRGEMEDDSDSLLVLEVVVRLVSVCLMVGPVEADLRTARRNRSRIAIVVVIGF